MALLLTGLLLAATVVIGDDDARAATPAGRTESIPSTLGAHRILPTLMKMFTFATARRALRR
jgi:hypothetical protein